MKFLYTRREVDEAIHNALAEHDKERYQEKRYLAMEKEIESIKMQYKALDDLSERVFNLEMRFRWEMDQWNKRCDCNKNVDPTQVVNE